MKRKQQTNKQTNKQTTIKQTKTTRTYKIAPVYIAGGDAIRQLL